MNFSFFFFLAAFWQNQVILHACQTSARFHLSEARSSSKSPSLHSNPAELSCAVMGYQGFKGCHCVSYDGMDLLSEKFVIVTKKQNDKMVIN